MSIERRLEKLEEQAKNREPREIWFVLHYHGTPEMSEAEVERKKAEYRKAHPDWKEQLFHLISPDE